MTVKQIPIYFEGRLVPDLQAEVIVPGNTDNSYGLSQRYIDTIEPGVISALFTLPGVPSDADIQLYMVNDDYIEYYIRPNYYAHLPPMQRGPLPNSYKKYNIFRKTLKNIPYAREGMEARKIWNTKVNLPFTSGPGRNYASQWPRTVAPNRYNSRKLTYARNINNGLSRIQPNLFSESRRKRSKTRKH